MQPLPYYHNGEIHTAGYFEINSVTWWILKNHGIKIKGVESRELEFDVDWNLLISRMRNNLNTYWYNWTKRVDRYLVMLTDWGIQWMVLGVLRQYYSFEENEITTKEKAGAYALEQLPYRWKPIIQEALKIRAGQKKSINGFKIKRMTDDVKFIRHIIQISNHLFE